jgi:GNAT superfamily N-acetyltransferase
MTTSFRDGMPEDAAALDRIFDVTFSGTFGHLYRPEDLHAFLSGFTISDWERELGDGRYAYRIAEECGVPVGYAKLGPRKIPVEPGGPALLLDQIYVLKEHHGTGIATGLMDWAIGEAKARGAEELYLTVFIENERARRFYGRYGFQDVGRYAFMVGEQADEDIILRKRL